MPPKEDNGTIQTIFHISRLEPLEATIYHKDPTERIHCVERYSLVPMVQLGEVRIIRCGGPKRNVIDYNPTKDAEYAEVEELTLWMWGQGWISNLDWDPKDWQWRIIGILADTTVLNYTTKRGYRAALQQNHHQMKLDAELETSGIESWACSSALIGEQSRTQILVWLPRLSLSLWWQGCAERISSCSGW